MNRKLLIAGVAVCVNAAANITIATLYDDQPGKIRGFDVLLVLFGPAPLYWRGSKLYAENEKRYRLR